MIGKIWFISLAAFVVSQHLDGDIPTGLNKLKDLTSKGVEKIENVKKNIQNARDNYINISNERLQCLVGEHTIQKNAVNKTITEAVFKGMLKNKQFSNFQCISNAGAEILRKLDSSNSQIRGNYENILNKNLQNVYAYRLVLNGFDVYTQDLYKKKSEEIAKLQKEDEIQKILKEVEEKMKQMIKIVDQINETVSKSKFQFFEELVDYIHKTENEIKKIQREGSSKIMFCVF